jgi:hypothetical protein
VSSLTFEQLEQLVGEAGGSPTQEEYLAGIAAGVESGGDPTAQNPTSTASGLWQELTTTWIGNGGGAYAPTAAGASPLDQAIVAVNQSKGGYQPWAPDLGGAYGAPGAEGDPTAPAAGSPVANYLASIGVTGPGTAPTGTPTAAGTSATDVSLNGSIGDLFGIPQTIIGGAAADIWSEVGPFIAKTLLVVAGIGIVGLGLYKVTDTGKAVQDVAQAAPLAAAA